jgi:hypothetical protein
MNLPVKFIALSWILVLGLSSCGTTVYLSSSSLRVPFDEYRVLLQDFEKQRSDDDEQSIPYDLERWYQCDSYTTDVPYKGKYLATSETIPWKAFGYCWGAIDKVKNAYIFANVYTNKDSDFISTQDKKLAKLVNYRNPKSFERVCDLIVKEQIESQIFDTPQGRKLTKFLNADLEKLVHTGCVLRFTDTLPLEVKIAKAGIANEKARAKADLEAERQYRLEEEEQARLEEEEQARLDVDTNSREYITGLTIGNNFSDFSDAGAKAETVCATARDRRIVLSSRGGIGVDPKTATFLNSNDGFQGCIDGFNGVPQD